MEIDAKQLYIEGFERKIFSCAFTGHRTLGPDFREEKLEEAVRSCVSLGVNSFYCGMAVGFDLCAAECVLHLKKEVPSLSFIACIPCEGQEKAFSKADKERYYRLLEESDVKVILSETYYRGCMLKRNAYMADKADALIAYCRKNTGGAAYTVKCFQKKNKPVFLL